MKNINVKKIVSLMLAGGLTLASFPKNVKAEGLKDALTPEEIVQMCESNIKRNMSYNDYCMLCYIACNYLNELGLNVSINELYSPIYLTNFTYMSEEDRNTIIENGFIPSNINELINEAYSIFGMIATYNDNLFIKALDNHEIVDYEKMIHPANLCFNQKDKDIANSFDGLLSEYIDTGKTDCVLFSELLCGYTKIPNSSEYSLEQASIGAEKLINLTNGMVFYFHVSPMHPVDGNTIADEETLDSLYEYLGDLSSVVTSLGGKCKIK